MNKRNKIALLLLLVISVSIYMNSIYGDFMLDDEMLIQKYPVIRHFSMDILTYRLVRTLSYAVDYHFWGLNPLGYHLSNLLYNTLTVLAVFFLTRRLTGIFFVSISTALLFAVHPIHTEAVSYLSGRRDILSALFYFLGFLSYIKARQERIPWMYGLVLLCYVAGILSKEMAITLPLIIFAYEVILWIESHSEEQGSPASLLWHAVMDTGKRFRWIIFSSMLFVIGYLYVIIFLQKASGLVRAERFLWWGGTPVANFATVSRVIVTYIRKLFFPVVLQVDYHQFPYSRTFLDLRVLSACTVIFILIGISVILLKNHRLLTFSIWWFLITLLPVMQIIPHHILMAEHYLYLPSYGFCLMTSLGFYKVFQETKLRTALILVLVVLTGIYSVRTIDRNQDWRSIIILMREGLRHNPKNPLYHFFLGRTYGLNGLFPSANRELAMAIGSRNDYSDTHAVKALVAFQQGDYAQGVDETRQALERMPENEMALYNMGFYALQMEDYQTAMEYSLRVDPNYEAGNALARLASIYMKKGDLARAEEVLLKLLKTQPENATAHLGLAEMYTHGLRFEDAVRIYKNILKKSKSMYQAENGLAQNIAKNRVAESLHYVEKLRDQYKDAMNEMRNGQIEEAHKILGKIYLTIGNNEAAVGELKKAVNVQGLTPEIGLLLGEASQRLGKISEAEKLYSLLRSTGPNSSVDVLVAAGEFYARTLRFKKAEELFRIALKMSPEDETIRKTLNWSIGFQKLYESYQQLGRSGRPVAAALKMSDIYVRLGRNQDAMKVLEDDLEIDPENADLLKELALLYETMGYPYWGKTIRTYRHLLSIDHKNAEAYRRLGEFYYTVIKDYESALECFQQSLKIAPDQEGYEQVKFAIQKLQQYVKLYLGDDPRNIHITVR